MRCSAPAKLSALLWARLGSHVYMYRRVLINGSAPFSPLPSPIPTAIDMTGPPTPPITSAIEIEDAARTAQPSTETTVVTGGTAPAAPGEPVAPQVAIAETPQQVATPYRQAFATLAELAAAGKFKELVEVAETADLTVRIAPLYPGLPIIPLRRQRKISTWIGCLFLHL